MAVTKPGGIAPKKPSKPKGSAHYGGCPPGQIRDHNQRSKSYGKCISVLAKKKKPNDGGFKYG